MDKDSKFELFNRQKEDLFDKAFESISRVEEERRREAEARRREAEEREKEEREYAKDVANDICSLLSQLLEEIKQSGRKTDSFEIDHFDLKELKGYKTEYLIDDKSLYVRLHVDFNEAKKNNTEWLCVKKALNEKSLINILSRSGLTIHLSHEYENTPGYPELSIEYRRYAKEEKNIDSSPKTI